MTRYKHLTAPLTIAGLTLKNRMFSAPTSMAELGPDEHYSKENIEYYKLRALGGAAVVPVGDVIVDLDTGRSHPQQVGINEPSAAPYLCAVADAIHAGGAMASVEIDHGGALCPPEFIGGKKAMGPSGYVDPWGDEVLEMTEEQIFFLADKFAQGAANAKAYGFDMVLLHGGHGWLLHQFISPITNHRRDKWGGSLENRMRFPLLVIEKMREAVGPKFPIEIRFSGTEYAQGGYGPEEGIEIAKMLDGKVDLLHVSAGTMQEDFSAVLMHPGAFQEDMHNAYLAAEIKKHVKTPVLSVGAFNMPDAMEKFLEETGVVVEPKKIIGIRFNSQDWYIAFSAEYVSGQATSDYDENDEVVWMDVNEALQREDVPDLTKQLIRCALKEEKGLVPLPYVGNPKKGKGYLFGVEQ